MAEEGTRERLLRATAEVMAERGLSGVTVRQIAGRAGVAEGALYRHFPDKVRLVLAMVLEKWPGLADTMVDLLGRVGRGTVRGNLERAVRAALAGYAELMPFVATVASDPEVLAAVRAELAARDLGPVHAHRAVASYLQQEQEGGRVRLTTSPAIAAAVLLGACHEYAFLHLLHDRLPFPERPATYAREVVALVLPVAQEESQGTSGAR